MTVGFDVERSSAVRFDLPSEQPERREKKQKVTRQQKEMTCFKGIQILSSWTWAA
jgi:hypothetical protein